MGGYTAVKRKTPAPSKKAVFPSDKNLMCNFNSGNGLIDPKSVFQDIKLILKVFKINKIWVKSFFSRPPSSSQPKNSFLACTVSFLGGFSKRKVSNCSGRPTLQVRQVPYLIFLKHHLCLAHHWLCSSISPNKGANTCLLYQKISLFKV